MVCAALALFVLADLAIPALGVPALLLALLALLLTWAAFCALLWVGGERLDRPWAFALAVLLGLLVRVSGLGLGPSVGARLLRELVVVYWGCVVFFGLFLAFRQDRGARLLAGASIASIWGGWLAWARDPDFLARTIYAGAPIDGVAEWVGLAVFVGGIGAASFVSWSVRLLAREALRRDP